MHINNFPRRMAMIAALVAEMILVSGLRAQPTEQRCKTGSVCL